MALADFSGNPLHHLGVRTRRLVAQKRRKPHAKTCPHPQLLQPRWSKWLALPTANTAQRFESFGVTSQQSTIVLMAGRQGHGHIINVSSVGGFVVQSTAAVYAATKFAVRAISEGLRKESDKIRCTCVYPGGVESELADTISDQTARERMKAYRKMAIQPERRWFPSGFDEAMVQAKRAEIHSCPYFAASQACPLWFGVSKPISLLCATAESATEPCLPDLNRMTKLRSIDHVSARDLHSIGRICVGIRLQMADFIQRG
jgi:hypothetical protein